MQSLIENFLNGNLSDAKRKAKRYGFVSIMNAFCGIGYSPEKAIATAAFLKGQGSFQEACDA